jgi:lysophospholipase L1-like esterase
MKKVILSILFLLPLTLMAQENEVTLKISGEEYKQLERHFNGKNRAAQRNRDWASFWRYEKANAELTQTPKVVFMGNSITDNWARMHKEFFEENNFAGRGIGGQTTSEMLVRFQADVIALKPKLVLIMAGTNDVAGNNGMITLEHAVQNIISMCELAKVHGIRPLVCSVPPCAGFNWAPEVKDAAGTIRTMNNMLKAYCKKAKIDYVDYWTALAKPDGTMKDGISSDGCHPTLDGYAIMEPIALKAIRKYVKK